jgi:hypothetical protein
MHKNLHQGKKWEETFSPVIYKGIDAMELEILY